MSERNGIRHVIRESFESNSDARISAAVALYAGGAITLGTAVRFAGVGRFEMRNILGEEDIELGIGPEDESDARSEIETGRYLE